MIVCLSPNGCAESRGDGPALVLMVATLRGLRRFDRKSADQPWTETGRYFENKHISCLLHEPNSGLLFAGCHGYGEEGGLYVSADEGKTWTPRMQGLNSPHIYTLAAQDRGGKTVLFTGTEPPAIYRSDDLGETWTDLPSLREVPGTEKWIFPPPPHIAHVKNIAFHPAHPDTLYVSVEQGAVLKTEDAGKTWRELDAYATEDDSFYHDVHRVVIAAKNPNRVHLATGDGLYFSADGGENWDHQQGRTDRVGYPDALFLDPTDDNTVYMGGAGDAPETWRTQGGALAGFIVSHDGGKTWAELMNGLNQPIRGNIEAMAMHSWSDGGLAFYAGTAVGDVFTSDDGGKSWRVLADGLPPVSKARHYRHFLSAEEKARIEGEARKEGQPAGAA
ncbi:MAG: hypothetical protein ABIO39_00940 [Caulobacteraceae bacterium]